MFHQLDRREVRSIVDVQLARFGERLKRRDLGLRISDEAKDYLGNVGFDPTFGARPLKRAIQQHLENPLAQQILGGAYQPGDVVTVSLRDDALTFDKEGAELPRGNAPGGRA